jgi:hypothetical protein
LYNTPTAPPERAGNQEAFMADDWGLMEQWEAEPACPECEAELEWIECEQCNGEGVSGHDCGEDCCACLDPEDNDPCDMCRAIGGWYWCPECEVIR